MHTRVRRVGRVRRYLALPGVLIIGVLALASPAPARAALTPGFSFGGSGTGNGQFQAAQGAAIDPSTGDLWVVDYGTGENDGRVEKFSPSGQYLLSADTQTNGALYGPLGVAVNASGDVFVAASQAGAVLEFGSDGSFIQSISDGNLSLPQYVAVDPSNPNNIFVSQGVDNDVVEYAVSGSSSSFVRTIGTSGPGALNNALGVAVNPAGDLYVVDAGDNLVKEYSTTGTYIQSFGGGEGGFSGPTALTIDPLTNNVVVSDVNGVQTLDSAGDFLSSFPTSGNTPGVAVDPSSGDQYVVDGSDNQVTKFTGATGEIEQPLGTRTLGFFVGATADATDPTTGDVYIDYGNKVEKRDAGGNLISTITFLPDYVTLSYGVAVDGSGNVFVAIQSSTSNNISAEVQEYNASGTYVRTFGVNTLQTPGQLAIDPANGEVFVADSGDQSGSTSKIYAFDPSTGQLASSFAVTPAPNKPVGVAAYGIAVNATGTRVYVGDSQDELFGYTPSGTQLFEVGGQGSGAGQFQNAFDVAADPSTGSVFVVDSVNDRIERFDSSGLYVGQLSVGEGTYGVAVGLDPNASNYGDVYAVNDDGTHNTANLFRFGKPAPASTSSPSITGTAQDGQTLTASAGSWSSPDTLSYSYQWQDCPSGGGGCTNVASGGTSASYTATSSDVGSFLQVVVTATDQQGQTGTATQQTAVAVAKPAAPQNTALPSIRGTAQDGQALTASHGTWKSPDTLSYTYQWQDCPSGGGACANVASGGTSAAYRAVASDVGAFLQVVVTATDKEAQAVTSSAKTSAVVAAPAAPAISVAPAITGTPKDGQTVTTSNGSWTSPDALTYAYQWQDCPSGGGACTNVASGGTSAAYRAVASDVGSFLQIVVTATDKEGQTGTSSTKTSAVVAAPAAPAASVAPTITGTPKDGQTLTANHGTWTSPDTLTYAYQWQDCPSGGGACSNVASGGTSFIYRAAASDVGSFLQIVVTATDKEGQTGTASTKTTVVVAKPAAPTISVAPTITGTPKDGQTLTAGHGSWTSPDSLSFAYQWQDCPSGGGACANVASGGTSTAYRATASDVGSFLQVVVIATDKESQTGTTTKKTSTVVAKPTPPQNTAAPTISGTAQPGQKLVAHHGTWSTPDTLTYTYLWKRCSSTGTSCQSTGVTGSIYAVQTADSGHKLQLVVTATDQEAQSGSASALTAVVSSSLGSSQPSATAADAPMGGPTPVTAARPRVAYRWERCSVTGSRCVAIRGARHARYRVRAADAGRRLTLIVTVHAHGERAAHVTLRVGPSPAPAGPALRTAPAIIGASAVGQTVAVRPHAWRGRTRLRLSYRWLRCSPSGRACLPITGPTQRRLRR